MTKQTLNGVSRKFLGAFLAMTVFTLPVLAQQGDFSGTWTLTQKTSLSGKDYVNSIANQVNVKQTGDSIAIQRTTQAPGQDDHISKETLTMDGKPNVINTATGSKKTAVVQLATDRKSFTESGTYSDPAQSDKVKYKIIEAWSISADGGTLTIIKNFENPNDVDDKWSVKGEYNKD